MNMMTALKQVTFLVGISLSVALGIVLYMMIKDPIYRPLDYQVNQKNMSTIIDTLEKSGIQYKINDPDGVLMVPAKDVQLAKMKLSSAGVQKDDAFSYAFLNEQSGLANSQFLDNARYLRALESDLSKTIKSIEGVGYAKVHIAVPQNNIFADEDTKTTASIMLSVDPSFIRDKEKIRAIMQIIAGSVPGLDPKNVAISDQYGHFLSEGMDQNSIYSVEQLNFQNKVQSYYEKRVESMIIPMMGQNKVTVKVNANVDFTQQEDASESYDPDKKVIRSEESISEQAGSSAASGPPGSLSNQPPDESGKAPPPQSSSSQGRSQSTKNYELSKLVSYKKTNYAKIKNLSVAVVVDNEMVLDPKTNKLVAKPLAQDKINKITELVKATIGFDQARGDKVTVINSGYNADKQEMVVSDNHLWEQVWFWDMVKKYVGIAVGFIFLFILYRKLSGYANYLIEKAKKQELQNAKLGLVDENNELHNAKTERINKLKQLATDDPGQVALIIKNWVGSAENE